jgi:ParB/RepB/Spo0J family partition protein
MSVEDISISKLKISEFNVRKEVGDVSELAGSIAEQGLFQPLLVRPENGKYGIIIGSRRFAAAQQAKIKNLPVMIRDLPEDKSLIISLADNIQRNEVEPIDSTHAIDTLLNKFHYNVRDLSNELGKGKTYVASLATTVHLVDKLDKAGVKVLVHPPEEDRDRHKAVPIRHAIAIAQGFNRPSLKPRLESEPDIDAEMAQKGSDLKQKEIMNVVNYLEDHPNKSVDDVIAEGKDYVRGGGGSFGGGGGSEGKVESETKLWHNKLMYNLQRNETKYDCYTIGFSGTELNWFIEKLRFAKVRTLFDVRKNPSSMYKPEFNKDNLSERLKQNNIDYFHLPDWGIEKEFREDLNTIADYEKLWKWYDKNIVINVGKSSEPWDYDGPWAFMCTELDPTKCHRHRIAKQLEEEFQTKSMDL